MKNYPACKELIAKSKNGLLFLQKCLLKEYLVGGDLNEAIATLKELNAPLK